MKEKILVTIDGITLGGAQKVLELLIPKWIEAGHEVRLIVLQNSLKEINLEPLSEKGLVIFRANATSMLDIKAYFFCIKQTWIFRPSQIHAHLYWSQLWSATFKFLRLTPCLIWIEHNTYLNRTKIQWLMYEVFSKFSDKIIAVSIEVKDFLKNKTSTHVEMIPNPISDKFQSVNRNMENPKFVFVGRLAEQKNPKLAIQSFLYAIKNQMIPLNSNLIIAGEGPMLKQLREFVELNEFAEKIRFVGFQLESELIPLYQSAHALLSTSRHEGSPLVRLEALASGCTVITTNTGGIKGVLTQSSKNSEFILGAFLVLEDEVDIAKAMSRCLSQAYWTNDAINQRTNRILLHNPKLVAIRYLVNFRSTEFIEELG